MSADRKSRVASRAGLGLQYRLLVVAYVGAVVLFSYRENLTLVAKIIAALLGLSFLFVALARGRRIVIPMTYRIWGIWFALAILSSAMADSIALALSRALTLTTVGAVGFLLTNFLIWNRSTRFYVLTLIGAALISTLMVLASPGTFATVDGRVFGTLGNSNTFGILLSATLVLTIVSGLAEKRKLFKVALFAVAVPIFTMLLQTGSRKAMIGGVLLGGGLICLAWLYKAKAASGKSFMVALIAIGATVPIAIGYLTTSDFWYRTERALEAFQGDMTDADSSLVGRLWLAQRAFEIAVQRPLIGIGLDNFRAAQNPVVGGQIGAYTHSNYLEVLVSTGILGFVLYFAIYWLWLRKLYEFRHLLREREYFGRYTMVLVLIVTSVVMDVAMVSYYDKMFWLIFPWLVAELHLLEAEQRQRVLSRNAAREEARRAAAENGCALARPGKA